MGEEFDVSQASHVEIPVHNDNSTELPSHDNGSGATGALFDDLFVDPGLLWPAPSYGDFFLPDEGFGFFNDYEMYGTAGAAWVGASGTSVVVVPLVALRADMVRRCLALGISCVAWESRLPPDEASIVLVTPESALTPDFFSFFKPTEDVAPLGQDRDR